ncbi:siderophore iron transporter 1 [Cladochytrium replicatum]|nr:siderophore iron transporter 1 [Cladochytrium replicatum]
MCMWQNGFTTATTATITPRMRDFCLVFLLEPKPSHSTAPHKMPLKGTGDDADRRTMSDNGGSVGHEKALPAGVARAKAVFSSITTGERVLLFGAVFLITFAYGLDSFIRGTFKSYATADYSTHSLLSTIGVFNAIVAVVLQPTLAKVSDIVGRMPLLVFSVVFYVLGTIIQATSSSVEIFALGAVLYQVGFSTVLILIDVIVADVSSSRTRVLFITISYLPLLIYAWITGEITEAILASWDWRWGIGVWAIIYPVAATPLIAMLWFFGRRTRNLKPTQDAERKNFAEHLKEFDIVGIILLIAVMGLILTPLTIAGGSTPAWQTPQIITPIVIGILLVPALVLWELRTKNPFLPFTLLKNRGIWSALAIAVFLTCSWYLQGAFLYTVLVVAFDFSVADATRISLIYHVTGAVTSFLLSYIIYRVRRIKIFVIIGSFIFVAAFGVLIYFRGGADNPSRIGVIMGEVLLGIAGGFVPIPTQAALQVATRHENMAVITGLFLASYQVGSALGNTISGAVWTQTLYSSLESTLGNATLAESVYGDPFSAIDMYPFGTPERTAIVERTATYNFC